MSSSSEIRISENVSELFRAAALQFSELANAAVRERGRFCVALSGGSTPKALYELLATRTFPVPWEKIYFFWGDERHVPPDDPESNYRMAYEALLSKVPVTPGNIFRILAEESDAAIAAAKYEDTLRAVFNLAPADSPRFDLPRFDLILLGLGPDGHTASLFPDTAALRENRRLVAANWVEQFHANRITLTLPVLNHAAVVTFLVSGQDKAAILRDVLEGPSNKYPSQLVCPEAGKLIWLLDHAAASQLRPRQ